MSSLHPGTAPQGGWGPPTSPLLPVPSPSSARPQGHQLLWGLDLERKPGACSARAFPLRALPPTSGIPHSWACPTPAPIFQDRSENPDGALPTPQLQLVLSGVSGKGVCVCGDRASQQSGKLWKVKDGWGGVSVPLTGVCAGWRGQSHVLHGVPTSSEKRSVPAAQAWLPRRPLPSCRMAACPSGAPGTYRAGDCHFAVPVSVWLPLCPKRSINSS